LNQFQWFVGDFIQLLHIMKKRFKNYFISQFSKIFHSLVNQIFTQIESNIQENELLIKYFIPKIKFSYQQRAFALLKYI
jgi:hypothetical protein